jgi:predicted neutral ceramidase superfamily lipid hydrolase
MLRDNMTGTPKSPPTLAATPSTGGTPGKFQGKSYKIGKAELTNNLSEQLAELAVIVVPMHSEEARAWDASVQVEIDKITKKISDLQDQGADTKKAFRQVGLTKADFVAMGYDEKQISALGIK